MSSSESTSPVTPEPTQTHAVSPRRGRALALLLVGPLLVNGISLMLALLVYLRAAQQCPPNQLLWLGFSYYGLYATMSYLASRHIPPNRAAWALRGALVALLGLTWLAPRVGGFPGFLALSALNGGVIGFYFAPLQLAMQGIRPCRTTAWTIAFYNISWGLGAAVGPFVSGWLEPLTAQAAAGGGAGADGVGLETWVLLGVAAAVGVHLLLDWLALAQNGGRGMVSRLPAAAAVVAAAGPAGPGANLPAASGSRSAAPGGFESTATLRKSGFIGAATVTLLRTGLLTTLWPALCVQERLSPAEKAWGLMLLGVPVPLLAPVWAALHRHFQRPWLSYGLLGLLVPAVGLAPWASTAGLLAMMSAVGVAVSGLVYLALFYANTDPRWPSNSVGLTEAFIGGGGLVGPMLLGSLAGTDARTPLPYLVGAGLAVATVIGVAVVRWKSGRSASARPAALPPPAAGGAGGF